MTPTIKDFKLLQAMLRTELSVNAMTQALYKAGFICERNVYDLSQEILELVGFAPDSYQDDELLHFYVSTLDRLTDQNLLENTDNIHDVAMQFYAELQARLSRF